MMRNLWPLLAGFGIWAAGLSVIYSVQALGCVWLWTEAMHRTVLVGLAILTLAALAILFIWQQFLSPPDAVWKKSSSMLTALALAATVVTFLPTTFATLCQ
ncbi:MAG: hypothetical protein P0Y65_16980 [Candidatus Devosia phytovorans]|uniref:Uncharacterized protein n=1 Tax=Candidatus Devosia phytovorans TaxID=3121372 RepID=A0AAJ5VS87_9HYPH|nr:hypothetical protein [Devosia sp.]WEK03866.1 MAG: hypothetical protein P0Y65_16980 [Devosia sp.]